MGAKDQPHKIWRRKEQQITPTKNASLHDLRGTIWLHYGLHVDHYKCFLIGNFE